MLHDYINLNSDIVAERRGLLWKDSSRCDWLDGGVSGKWNVLVGPDGVLVEVVLEDVQVFAEVSDL